MIAPRRIARAYLEVIERTGRGIVLMHDSTADIDAIRARNRALGLARVLVPELRHRGFRFIRLDAIPQVTSAARVTALWTLIVADGSHVSAPPDGVDMFFDSGPADSPDAILGAVPLGADRWALRASNGLFLSRREGAVVADAQALGMPESLTIEPRGGDRIALRTSEGAYLSGTRGPIRAEASVAGETEIFTRIVDHGG